MGLMGTMRASKGNEGSASGNARLAPVMTMMQGSLARFPPVGRLAAACGLSVRHFQRAFNQAFGMSPRTYWMKCRIRSACARLQQGDESIAVIADELGFCDQSNFTRHFRQHAGLTPRKFVHERRRHRS